MDLPVSLAIGIAFGASLTHWVTRNKEQYARFCYDFAGFLHRVRVLDCTPPRSCELPTRCQRLARTGTSRTRA